MNTALLLPVCVCVCVCVCVGGGGGHSLDGKLLFQASGMKRQGIHKFKYEKA